MLRKALVLGAALVSSLAGSLVAVAAGPFFAEEAPATSGAPFSAVVKTQSVTTFADGNRIVRTNTVKYFRDGQGRTRTERGDGPNRSIMINDPVGGEYYVLRPEKKVVFAYKVPNGAPVPPGAAAAKDKIRRRGEASRLHHTCEHEHLVQVHAGRDCCSLGTVLPEKAL